ncbi:MAG: hypothetical protein ACQKBU_08425 [Verrucomicrobiales bacterium]
MADESLQLQDLVPAEPFVAEPAWPWWIWLLIALTLAAASTAVVILLRKRGSLPVSSKTLDHSEARRRAIEEIEASSSLPPREAATRISGSIRLYLATICGDPSLFETHEEFIARHHALADFSESTRTQASTTLTLLAESKYDRPSNSNETDLSKDSRALIEQLHQEIAP